MAERCLFVLFDIGLNLSVALVFDMDALGSLPPENLDKGLGNAVTQSRRATMKEGWG